MLNVGIFPRDQPRTSSYRAMNQPQASLDQLRQVIERHWGYRSFRPLQEQAMKAALDGRDSLVVMPTGGGKSLCYQAPAIVRGGTTLVISPLISLMKDQVDGLRACNVPAVQLDSSLSPAERLAHENDVRAGAIRLLFVSPERLLTPEFCNLCRTIDVKTVAIDEAHCISHWGHDFRPEYRQLKRLKDLFPGASVHGYTATATEQVRTDICKELNLTNPLVLVGNFDRPNLTYRVMPRTDEFTQIKEVLGRHKGEAGIIYCISRKSVDTLSLALQHEGVRALPYHAGMDKVQRRAAQEAFITENCDVIVATVAFGMGIDRSNVRFVIHAAMPKSIEHYQQESGRAGRDGLEAECVLLHGHGDIMTWKYLMEKASEEAPVDPAYLKHAFKHLNDMDRYCNSLTCRHRSLVQYFGQKYVSSQPAEVDGEILLQGCSACDVCLGDAEPVSDSLVLAQKMLSCVARVQERFGVNHVISVLRGENLEKIRSLGHDKLTTFGLLREHDRDELGDWLLQLIGQGVLVRAGDEYPVLKLNAASWEVMKKQRAVRLLRRKAGEKTRKSRAAAESWEGVERDLFDRLCDLRRELAVREGLAPHMLFSDHTVRELARVRPSSLEKMKLVTGISEHKLAQHGAALLPIIQHYCQARNVAADVPPKPRQLEPVSRPTSGVKAVSFNLFEKGYGPEEVAQQTNRSIKTIKGDLAEYIRYSAPASIDQWVKKDIYDRVAAAVAKVGADRLKPIFEELKEEIPYEEIRLVVAHLDSKRGAAPRE
jgi:ATP-dependent DNA helicase RecQ